MKSSYAGISFECSDRVERILDKISVAKVYASLDVVIHKTQRVDSARELHCAYRAALSDIGVSVVESLTMIIPNLVRQIHIEMRATTDSPGSNLVQISSKISNTGNEFVISRIKNHTISGYRDNLPRDDVPYADRMLSAYRNVYGGVWESYCEDANTQTLNGMWTHLPPVTSINKKHPV